MTYLNNILGTKYPIIQGGMANIATGAFAAECSNAGALGIIAGGGMDAERLAAEIHACRALTDKPFGVNLMLMNPHADEIADMLVREGVKYVTTGAGSPGKYMDSWKAAGMTVMPVSASVTLAKRLVRDGADLIIAEGTESGGHVGEMTTLTLLPQMVDALDVPVVGAGGIADGRQAACAFALGACGIQIGTVLLATYECPIHDNYKAAILKAKDNGTTVTGRSVDAPVRIIKNRMAREYLKKERAGATRDELETYTLGSLRKAVFDGNTEEGSLMSGQVCGQIKAIRHVDEVFRSLMEEAGRTAAALPGIMEDLS